ncbi:MAG: TerD family protein [Clostridia bacterium]|nr:TerD family protein [Clostridia bacterium]
MAVSLKKGGKVSLVKAAADAGIANAAALTQIKVGLGWDVNRYDGGAAFDLDAAAFMLAGTGKVRSSDDFIFYNQKVGPGVVHQGDNRTGEGEGDDEVIDVDLAQVPADIERISFTVTIDQADVKNQNFGMVENSYIRVFDPVSGTELIRYDLGEDFSVETAVVVADLYRHGGEWKFNAIGSGFAGGLAALCANFGVDLA